MIVAWINQQSAFTEFTSHIASLVEALSSHHFAFFSFTYIYFVSLLRALAGVAVDGPNKTTTDSNNNTICLIKKKGKVKALHEELYSGFMHIFLYFFYWQVILYIKCEDKEVL